MTVNEPQLIFNSMSAGYVADVVEKGTQSHKSQLLLGKASPWDELRLLPDALFSGWLAGIACYRVYHPVHYMNRAKRVLEPSMSRSRIHEVRLPQLKNTTKPLKCGVVDYPHFLRVQPNKSVYRQEELLAFLKR